MQYNAQNNGQVKVSAFNGLPCADLTVILVFRTSHQEFSSGIKGIRDQSKFKLNYVGFVTLFKVCL